MGRFSVSVRFLAILAALVGGASLYLLSARAGAAVGAAPGARWAVTELGGVQYGTDGGPLVMDVYLPGSTATRRAAPVPVVLLIHGGGWAGGSRSDLASEARAVAAAGMAALDVDYRLAAPSTPGIGHQVPDLEQALAWARARAGTLGLDPARVGAFGVSAGGNLALGLGVRGLASAVVAWSAPTNLAALVPAGGAPACTAGCGPLSLSHAVYQYLGCLPAACPAAYRSASPADLVGGGAGAGTRYQLWSSTEELVPLGQAVQFTTRARAAGAAVTEDLVAGHRHAAEYAASALLPSVRFLALALAGSDPV